MELAIAHLEPAATRRVRGGYPWIFSEQISFWEGDPQAGELVKVQAGKEGQILGFAFANPASKIRLRMLYTPTAGGSGKIPDEAVEIARKLDRARSKRVALQLDATAWRWVWSEADGMPGLVLDQYNEFLVAQFLSLGMERRKSMILDWCCSRLKPKGIYERSTGSGRGLEGLADQEGWLFQAPGVAPKTEVEIREGDLRFLVNFSAGHKTGFYLDQRAGRRLIRNQHLRGRVLDGCAYTGGFSVAAARAGASEVVAVEASRPALEQLEQNAHLNQVEDCIRPLAGDIFDYLKTAAQRKEKFSLVILDPPAFAPSKKNLEEALKGYRELHRRAAQLLESPGWLLSCSCSHHVSPALFREVARQGMGNQGRRLDVIKVFGPDGDHPEKSQIPESRYLTCLWAKVK